MRADAVSAPVTLPAVAEARYLRALYRSGLRIAYAGICPPVETDDLDAAITFGDLEQIFRIRGVSLLAMPTWFERVPEERRRHLSTAGGLPLALLEESRYSSRRFRKIRGLEGLRALARAVGAASRARAGTAPGATCRSACPSSAFPDAA